MNIFLSLPMIIYLFYFDINFLSIKVVSHLSAIDGLNPSNKIFIISTLIFFYMLPFIYNQLSVTFFKKNFKIKHLYFSTIIFFYYYIFLIIRLITLEVEFSLKFLISCLIIHTYFFVLHFYHFYLLQIFLN